MRRVLIISPHFPPDTTAATHRARLIAPHLAGFGWQPTVLTVDPRDYEGALDPALARLVPHDLEVIRCRAWPASWTRAVGVGDLGLRSLRPLWHRACALMSERRYDAVFITIFPSYPALIGGWLKRRFGVPFVLDYQDPWVGSWGLSVGASADGSADVKSRLSRLLAERLEPLALNAADGVTAVSTATYDDALARVKPAHRPLTETLPIGWEANDLRAIDDRPNALFDPRDGRVHVCYVGTFLPHGERVLERVFAAARQLEASEPELYRRLHFWFVGTSNQTAGDPPARVHALARRVGVDKIVTEMPVRVGYLDALRIVRDASVVLLVGSTERHYTASKVFPAILARRPLLAVFHEDSSVVSLLKRIGRPPSVRVVTFDDALPNVDAVSAELSSLVRRPVFEPDAIDLSAAEPYSARAVALRLAALLDRVSTPASELRQAV